jgi:molybdopterin-binding protein
MLPARLNSEAFYNQGMKISARNQLRGTVETVSLGVITAKVGVRVGDNLIESVITRQSAEELNIKVGQQVTAIIKSTEVMLMVE